MLHSIRVTLTHINIGATWLILLNDPCTAAMRSISDYFGHLLFFLQLPINQYKTQIRLRESAILYAYIHRHYYVAVFIRARISLLA